MGQEIQKTRFAPEDFQHFASRLREETALFERWLAAGRFAEGCCVAGFELEAWLIRPDYTPAPENERYLAALNNPLVVPELSRFNVELNGTPLPLRGDALRRMEHELARTWRHAQEVAEGLGLRLLKIGILPTLQESALHIGNMSPMNRYFALNEQVLKQRKGRPIEVLIEGKESLRVTHRDVMLEAATTSFQLHLQVPAREAVRYYNAAQALSGPMVAMSTNSPFLFGRDLWSETRIPLFEQSVEVGGYAGLADDTTRRVTFGTGYADASLAEYFRENAADYPVLLPIPLDEPAEHLAHLRLHNGTIWRWNRALVGFESAAGMQHGEPHLRIEHRVLPSGPTLTDEFANAAFFYGLVEALAHDAHPIEAELSFPATEANFYTAAQMGLDAQFTWPGTSGIGAAALILDELLPLARRGLAQLDIDPEDIDRYLDIVERRVRSGQTGAAWQRAFVDRHGRDWQALTAAYYHHQQLGHPVHEWPID